MTHDLYLAMCAAHDFAERLLGREEAAEVPRLHIIEELFRRECRRTRALSMLYRARGVEIQLGAIFAGRVQLEQLVGSGVR